MMNRSGSGSNLMSLCSTSNASSIRFCAITYSSNTHQQRPIIPLTLRPRHRSSRSSKDDTIIPIIQSSSSSSQPKPNVKRKLRWTHYEHSLCLEGVKKHGNDKWKEISNELLPLKTPDQILRHYRGFTARQNTPVEERKRRSINDVANNNNNNNQQQQQEKEQPDPDDYYCDLIPWGEQQQLEGLQPDYILIPFEQATPQQKQQVGQQLVPPRRADDSQDDPFWDIMNNTATTWQQQQQQQAVAELNPPSSISNNFFMDDGSLIGGLNSLPSLPVLNDQHTTLHSNPLLPTPTTNNNNLPHQQVDNNALEDYLDYFLNDNFDFSAGSFDDTDLAF